MAANPEIGDIRVVPDLEHKVDRAQEILPRQVEILYENGLVILIANVVCAGLVATILGPELGRVAYIWGAAVVVVALACGVLAFVYRRRQGALPVLTWASLRRST